MNKIKEVTEINKCYNNKNTRNFYAAKKKKKEITLDFEKVLLGVVADDKKN